MDVSRSSPEDTSENPHLIDSSDSLLGISSSADAFSTLPMLLGWMEARSFRSNRWCTCNITVDWNRFFLLLCFCSYQCTIVRDLFTLLFVFFLFIMHLHVLKYLIGVLEWVAKNVESSSEVYVDEKLWNEYYYVGFFPVGSLPRPQVTCVFEILLVFAHEYRPHCSKPISINSPLSMTTNTLGHCNPRIIARLPMNWITCRLLWPSFFVCYLPLCQNGKRSRGMMLALCLEI